MHIDSFTLLLASCGLVVLFGAAYVALWLRDRRSVWLVWWGVPLIGNGIALVLYTRTGWDQDFISIAVGNVSRIAGLCAFWYGIRLFQGQRLNHLVPLTLMSSWVLLCFFPPFIESLVARIVVLSMMHLLVAALIVRDLWAARGDGLRSRLPVTLAFASYGAVMAVRIALAGIAPFPWGGRELDPVAFATFTWIVLGHVVFAAVFFFAMTMERREQEQRNFALSDPLTSLMNRRAFREFANRLARRINDREPVALMVLDIDHFKQVNDRFGHEAGDRLLQAFARVAEQQTRTADQLFRMGGEEFCFILPDTTLPEAVAIAERFRRAFKATAVGSFDQPVSTTVSIGVAATRLSVDLDVMLAAADAAVYQAKAQGRDRTVVADSSALTPPAGPALPLPDRRRA